VWAEVGPQLVDASSRGPAGLKALMERAHDDEGAARRRLAHRPDDDEASVALVRARLGFLGVQTIFSRWSGTLINRLFFDGGLTRKAPSYRLFRWLSPSGGSSCPSCNRTASGASTPASSSTPSPPASMAAPASSWAPAMAASPACCARAA